MMQIASREVGREWPIELDDDRYITYRIIYSVHFQLAAISDPNFTERTMTNGKWRGFCTFESAQ
jgi:hypothetical protein